MTIGLATWGLFVAWLLHDIEELALDYPPAQVYLGVGLVGVVMLAAAWDGARSGDTSAFYLIVPADLRRRAPR